MYKRPFKGFTILEVLIALLILGIGISFIYTVFFAGIRISNNIQFLDRTSFFAQKKIEELKISNSTLVDSFGQEGELNWTVYVGNVTEENNIALRKIQLDLEWQEGLTNIKKKSFVTYF